MQIGSGALDLGLSATRDTVGARLEYMHRLSRAWSAYGAAGAGFDRATKVIDYSAALGLRGEW